MLLIIGKFIWSVFWCKYNETQNMDITKKLVILEINIFYINASNKFKILLFFFFFGSSIFISFFMHGEIGEI